MQLHPLSTAVSSQTWSKSVSNESICHLLFIILQEEHWFVNNEAFTFSSSVINIHNNLKCNLKPSLTNTGTNEGEYIEENDASGPRFIKHDEEPEHGVIGKKRTHKR